MGLRKLLCVVAPPVLAAAVAGVWWLRMPRVNASLYDLIGEEAERIPAFLREASASEVSIIVSSADAEKAHAAARKLAEKFPVANDLPPGAIDFIRENRGGLVTRETAELLRTREGRAKIAKRAVRRLYASPFPPILGYGDDPFGLTDAWLRTLASPRMEKTPEGWPLLATNGVTRILLKHRLEPGVVADIDRTIAWFGQLQGSDALVAGCGDSKRTTISAGRREKGDSVVIRCAGAPVHAAVSARRCKGEIGGLTWFSLAVIAVLALVVFRSVRWLPLLACSLLVAALAGGVALVSLFREIHVMTFVMGTTVLGLVIDYSFHWLLSPEGEKGLVRKNLLVSFLTTEIALVPLMLASIPVLRQSAVFLGAGLAAALGYVLVCYPRGVGSTISGRVQNGRSVPRVTRHASSRVSRLVVFACPIVFLGVAVGLVRVTLKTEMTALYRPTPALLEAERLRAQFGEFDFSSFPSLAERRENAELMRELYGEQSAKLMEALGVRSLPVPMEPTVQLVRPQVLMDEIFGVWTKESLRRLTFSVLALMAVVAFFFRGRSVRILAPPVLSLLAVAGVLGWTRVPVNFFHILASFLLLGMGIDYAVFLHSGGRGVMRPALSSLLTSVAGFGALAFVSFPAVASFGVVLGLGLPVAFVAALLVRKGQTPDAARSVVRVPHAHTAGTDVLVRTRARRALPSMREDAEHGATLLGMETLLLLYRLFGLRVLHVFSALVGLCIWSFSPAVRRASPSLGKVILFTRSLADKFVVLADGRRLPRVETDGSPDAAQFVADVRSGKGVFVLSSHVGTIEVLTALGACDRTFHAWMDFDRTSVFNRFYLRHARRQRIVIHPISEFDMGTVFEAGDWIDRGDCLVMAGDRGEGAFRFAAAFDHPVYFVACLAECRCRYRAVIRRLHADRAGMRNAYQSFRSDLAAKAPNQVFDWNARK